MDTKIKCRNVSCDTMIPSSEEWREKYGRFCLFHHEYPGLERKKQSQQAMIEENGKVKLRTFVSYTHLPIANPVEDV